MQTALDLSPASSFALSDQHANPRNGIAPIRSTLRGFLCC
jgi:hypothetical protein